MSDLETKEKQSREQPLSLAPYPAVRLLVVVAGGILAGVFAELPLLFWVAIASGLLLLLAGSMLVDVKHAPGSFPGAFSAVSYLLFVFFCCAAGSAAKFHYAPRDGLIPFYGRSVMLHGAIDGRPDYCDQRAGWVMEVDEVFDAGRHLPVHDRAKVFMRSSKGSAGRLRDGDLIWVKGQLSLVPEAANAGEFNPRLASRMRQISVQLASAGPWQVMKDGTNRLGWFDRTVVVPTYDYIQHSLNQLLPDGEERKLASGVLTGERETMAAEVFEAFKVTGTAHILAVSGLNVGLLALIVQVLLQRMKVTSAGRWFAFFLFLFVLLVFCRVTGNEASVQRAALMAVVLLAGETFGQRSYPLNSLAVADVVILALNPLDLLNPGFLMTNAAVVAIFVIYPCFDGLLPARKGFFKRVLRFGLEGMFITLAAIIGVSPVIAYYFGSFSVVGLVANIPIVLFSNLLMYALVPMLLFNLISAAVTALLAASSLFFAELTLGSARWFSAVPMASVPLHPDGVEVWLYYVMLAGLLVLGYRKNWGRFLVVLVAGCTMLLWYSVFQTAGRMQPRLVTVNLGRDVAMLYRAGGETVLIDAGTSSSRYQKKILPQISGFGFAEPAAVAQFYSPDSVIATVPAVQLFHRHDRSMALSSAVLSRPAERVLRVRSKEGSLLLVSGTARLGRACCQNPDVAVVWLYRFGSKQQLELADWLVKSRPAHCLLVPGSFMTPLQVAALKRFAGRYPVAEVREKSWQFVVM